MPIIRTVPPLQSGSLKGLPGIPLPFCSIHISRIFGDPLSKQNQECYQKSEIAERRIQKIIKRMLRKSGVPILGKEEWNEPYERPFFKAEISIDLLPQRRMSSSVEMSLIQEVLLVRDSSIKIEAASWRYGPIRSYSTIYDDLDEADSIEYLVERVIRTHIRDGINGFISSYRSDNQGEGPTEVL